MRPPSASESSSAEQWLFERSEEENRRIRQAWRNLLSTTGDFGADLYKQFFAMSPEVSRLFTGDLVAQQRRLVETLDDAVQLADQPEQLLLLLQATGVRHAGYKVRQGHFSLLLRALNQVAYARSQGKSERCETELLLSWFHYAATIMRAAMASES